MIVLLAVLAVIPVSRADTIKLERLRMLAEERQTIAVCRQDPDWLERRQRLIAKCQRLNESRLPPGPLRDEVDAVLWHQHTSYWFYDFKP